jgi:PAS domain S-box-containing protein
MAPPTHVLLVEDNPAYSKFVTAAFESADGPFQITTADSLKLALDYLRKGGIDVVLLDLFLPDSEGLATLHRIQEAANSMPVVILSGVLDQRLAMAAVQAGAQDFLVKSEVEVAIVTRVVRYAIERRAVETRLRERDLIAEERFRLLSGATNDVIWDWNIETDALWWNENFETVFGYRRDEIEPNLESWTRHIHPDDADRVARSLREVLDGEGHRFWAEYRFRRKSGEFAFVLDRGQVIRNDAGKPVRMVGGMADMTERNRALLRIAEQASLLDRARDAILVRDMEHRVTYYNKSSERLYGWTAGDVMGQSVRDRFFPDRVLFDDTMRTLLAQGDWQGEISVTGRNGALLTVESHWTLMRDAAGEPSAVLVIDTDVTERKELERQFLRAQRIESIGTLAGGIAHDLNNMLAPVLMSIELLKDNPTDEERLQILSTIEASTRRGAEMVRQVLTFARGVEGDRCAVDVAVLLKEVEKFANDTFMKSITVRTVLRGDVVVLGDATQLHQVVINLCVNARDAMPNGGTLTLSASTQPVAKTAGEIDPALPGGSYVVIEVADTGTGMAATVLDRIFEPFFTSKATGKGTGLGLSTSLAIIKSHGGSIRVNSEIGRGSTFAVYLPALAGRMTAAAPTAGRTTLKRGAGELVLVVDDEESVLRMTALVLESFGYRVLAAASGIEAEAMFLAHRDDIQVVFTDMTMPGMDGAALIRRIREIDPTARVIAASGRGAHQAANVPGVIRFLPKPYTADMVLEAVTAAIRA